MPSLDTTQPDPPPGSGLQPGVPLDVLGRVLDLLPIPAIIAAVTGKAIQKNQAATVLPLDAPARLDNGSGEPVGHEQLLAGLVADGKGPKETVVAWQLPDREMRFRVMARPIPPVDGQAPLSLLTFLDLSSQDAVERELREALDTRDEFFSVATHELKDPLFSIQLSLQMLRHTADRVGPVPPHLSHHLDVCGRQVERLARIIDNLLDVSRIRGGKLRLDAEVLDLADLAREAVSRFEELARSAGCRLTLETSGPVLGYFDRLKLDQVLTNLLTNALKYGAGKPVVVRVREEGDGAVMEVEDQGLGIAPADHKRIFARFERASEAHHKQSLGLGLYIVRAIVETHGGRVRVRSDVGQGATFTVTLPRNRIHHQEASGQDSGETA